jgi:hypothetical protein
MRFKIAVIFFMIVLMAANASAGCGRWVVRDNTDYLKDPVFDEAMASSTVSSPEPGHADKSAKSATNTESAENASAKAKTSPELDLSGKWIVSLGTTLAPMNLILIQSKDRVVGYGSLKDNDGDMPVTTTGSLSNNTISLDARPAVYGSPNRTDKEYKMSLANVDGIFKGSYEIYIGGSLSERGNATATRS